MKSIAPARILNVDDNPAGLYAKSRILRRAGFEVIEAANGEQALRMVQSAGPSLVLLDVQLPDITGIEVCRRIKTSSATRHLPVLHISATYVAEEVQAISAESGADIYLVEPVAPEELITVVRTLLRLRSTEMGLADSEARLRLAIDQAEIATWDIDLGTGAAAFSGRLYEMLGYRWEERPATSRMWIERIHRDDRPRVEAALQAAIAGGTLFQCEHRILRANDGEERWLAPLGNVQPDAQGRLARVIGVVMDVTPRKRLEARREELLAHESTARSEAETAARLKDQFLATLSHELRTPMSAVLGWLQLLRSGRLDAVQTQHALDTIERNARLQNQLINDMLDVSRIVTGRLRLDFTPLAARPLLESALASVRPLAEAKQLTIDTELPPPGAAVEADGSRMEQVFTNVLANAIKFSQPGGRVKVVCAVKGKVLEVVVSDEGEGIAPEALPHIFELFRQADGSFTRSHGGLGLGLAIVRHLLDLHGGSVRAHSDGPGNGASFVIELPLTSMSARDTAQTVPGPAPDVHGCPLQGASILVVDDDPGAVEMVRRMLMLEGARVITASGAEEARQAYAHDPGIDIVISDIGMPQRDGYDLIRTLRHEFPGRGAPIAVAISGYARSEDRERALEAGFDLHVSKPFDMQALSASLAHLMRGRGRT
jgi:PAS domain S-box-containing protein